VGQRSEQAIAEMEAMGFPRADIDRAMHAAFRNPDRAIEYLLTGIPAHIQAEQRPAGAGIGTRGPTSPIPTAATTTSPSPAATTMVAPTEDDGINLFEAAAQAGQGGPGGRGAPVRPAASAAAGIGAGAAGAGGQINMDFLRNSPHFQHLRQLVQQQPAMLDPILQQVAEGNPQLAQMIGQNQEQFLQLLSEVCEHLPSHV
jgi:UV excision repair protein RAD23